MSEEIVSNLENVKNFVLNAKKEIESRDSTIKELQQKYTNLEDELKNLKKVSLVASLSRQLDNKNNEIEILQKQLHKLKVDSKKVSKKSIKKLEESEDEEEFEGYEIIEHEEMKLLKDIETRKLYFLINGKKGNYAGKQSKKGKIKLK